MTVTIIARLGHSGLVICTERCEQPSVWGIAKQWGVAPWPIVQH